MSLSATEIAYLMKQAKDLGVNHFEVEGFKASFAPTVEEKPSAPIKEIPIEEVFKVASPFDELTEDELKYYATPYFDELMAQKEAKKQRLEEEASLKERQDG